MTGDERFCLVGKYCSGGRPSLKLFKGKNFLRSLQAIDDDTDGDRCGQ